MAGSEERGLGGTGGGSNDVVSVEEGAESTIRLFKEGRGESALVEGGRDRAREVSCDERGLAGSEGR